MEIFSSLPSSYMHQDSTKISQSNTNTSEEQFRVDYDPQQLAQQISTIHKDNQTLYSFSKSASRCSEFSDQIVFSLLDLESKWIQKQTQIKEYVESLKKTIEEKNLKIEKLQIDNYKLSQKLTEIGKQKNSIIEKLNQIHEAMIQLQCQKLKNESEARMKNNSEFSHQNKIIKEILRITKEKDQQRTNSQNESESRQSEKKDIDTQNMEKRILSNLIKLFEQNFSIYPSVSEDSSSQKNYEYLFAKKDRDVRITAATTDTFGEKLQGSFIKKLQHSPIDSEKQNESKDPKKSPQTYKSARTITFSKDEEADEQIEGENNRFYSHNVIKSHPKISSQADSSELKESQKSDSKNQNQKSKNLNANQNNSGSSSLRIQSKALNQSYESSQFQKQKRKRSKSKKKTTNLDYSLSSSLVSDTETNQIGSRKLDQDNQSVFQPLTHEKNDNPKKQFHLSKLSVSSTNQKKIMENDSEENIKLDSQKNSTKNSTNFEQIQPQVESSQNQYEKTHLGDKSLGKKKVIDSECKVSNPELSSTLKHANLTNFCAYSLQNSPQNQPLTMVNCNPFISSASKKKFMIERQDSITFENTNQKKSQFEASQFDSKGTETKNRNFGSKSEIPNDKKPLFVQGIAPETKCSSFQEKSSGDSFYLDKSSSSHDPFRRLKLQSENSENQQQNKSNKFMFENQMLKSYNQVLEKQAKKMSQTQKLMEKFTSQNISILNKIHKKSIS